MDVPRAHGELPVSGGLCGRWWEQGSQSPGAWPQQAGPQQQLPSSSQASLKPDLSSLALPLLIALANAYLSPGGSFWLK